MQNGKIDTFLTLIRHEMLVEQCETTNRAFIKQIILRAGGEFSDIDDVLKHPTVKGIDDDLFYIKTSAS